MNIKYNMNIKNLISNMLVKRTNMFNARSNCINECTIAEELQLI